MTATWRVWIYDEAFDVDITPFLRTGDEQLTIDASGRVVFSRTGHPWDTPPCPFSLSPGPDPGSSARPDRSQQ